jgi:hypothetical protein
MSESDSQPGGSGPPASPAVSGPELIVLEALRIAHTSTGSEQYLKVYQQLGQRVGQRLAAAARVDSAAQPAAPAPVTAAAARALSSPAAAAEPMRIRVICATRADREGFFSSTALGRSLTLHRPQGVEVRLFPNNEQGLPSVYNTAMAESAHDRVALLFVHDDVYLCDFHWADRLREALTAFDIVGLVGNRRRLPGQPSWGFIDEKYTLDKRAHLSGTVGHGQGFPPDTIDVFGPSNQKVVLLDGLFIAARSEALQSKSVRFDERFNFHFYDLDFCRQAEQSGLTMGTWPISVVHQSRGAFVSDGWRQGYDRYLEKWGD